MTNYQKAKNNLKETSLMAKNQFPTDKPMIRQIINDSTHNICSLYDLSEQRQSLLHDYACTLHPKN
tara:strand:+ start:603 stop:800 length:198 start_codon:yes stop_codon:yes gene_type:complete